MKKIFLLLLLLVVSCLTGQETEEYSFPQPSQKSTAYHEYRLKKSIPPYGLDKVKKLIAELEEYTYEEDGDEYVDKFTKKSQQIYNSLSIKEKFTYIMIHPEINTQNCDIDIPRLEEDKKIFGYIPDGYDEVFWSNRQLKFLKDNRESVMNLIKESSLRSKRIGFNYKLALEEINAVEMIPFLIDFYNKDKKDGDILTLLMLLMKQNKYEPFIKSQSYEKLYYNQSHYEPYLNYNQANEKLILTRAADFYQQIIKK